MTNTVKNNCSTYLLVHSLSTTIENRHKVFRVCAEAAGDGSGSHAKSISKESQMLNFYTKFNTANGQQTGRERGDRAVWPLPFQLPMWSVHVWRTGWGT